MYTIQHFIDKFSAISKSLWCSFTQDNGKGQRCALGHCLPAGERIMVLIEGFWTSGDGSITPEGEALNLITIKYLNQYVAVINNGGDERFLQPTEKERVLAALQWCKEQEAQAVIAKALSEPDEEEEEVYQEDDEDYRVQKMKEDHPGHSEEAYRTGEKLGVDFPYVPGDPFW